MINLTAGYYWLKNTSYDKKLVRPINVFVFTENGYHFNGNWVAKGTYIQMIGTDYVFQPSYFDEWQDVEFIKLEEPN